MKDSSVTGATPTISAYTCIHPATVQSCQATVQKAKSIEYSTFTEVLVLLHVVLRTTRTCSTAVPVCHVLYVLVCTRMSCTVHK